MTHASHGCSSIIAINSGLGVFHQCFCVCFLCQTKFIWMCYRRFLPILSIDDDSFYLLRSHHSPKTTPRCNTRREILLVKILNTCRRQLHFSSLPNHSHSNFATILLNHFLPAFEYTVSNQLVCSFKFNPLAIYQKHTPLVINRFIFNNEGFYTQKCKMQARRSTSIGFFHSSSLWAFPTDRDSIT